MGLIVLMFPHCAVDILVLMDPMAFVRQPYRWIKQLSVEQRIGRTFAGAPELRLPAHRRAQIAAEGDTIDLEQRRRPL